VRDALSLSCPIEKWLAYRLQFPHGLLRLTDMRGDLFPYIWLWTQLLVEFLELGFCIGHLCLALLPRRIFPVPIERKRER